MQQLKKQNLKILGKRIKNLREEQSESLNKFCFSRGCVTPATWSRVENALVDVKFSTLVQMCAMLDISLEEMFKDVNFTYLCDD